MPDPGVCVDAQGLSIRLYHPESCPFDTFAYVDDDGAYASGLMQARLQAARQPVVMLLTMSRAHDAVSDCCTSHDARARGPIQA